MLAGFCGVQLEAAKVEPQHLILATLALTPLPNGSS